MKKHSKFSAALLAIALTGASAQAADGWFIPKNNAPKAAAPKPAPVQSRPAPAQEAPQTPPVLPLPPVPVPPAMAKENPPPQASIGIINVPMVMELSSAAHEIQQALAPRRDALQQEAQKEEAAWRADEERFQEEVQRGSTPRAQLEEKARQLEARRVAAQRKFADKSRILQEAYQVAFHQIERELEQHNGIISQVAGAHSMNLVLHAEQVVLHVEGQDISAEVAQRLNQILPHVVIPGPNEDPERMAKSGKYPTTADEDRINNGDMRPQEPAAAH